MRVPLRSASIVSDLQNSNGGPAMHLRFTVPLFVAVAALALHGVARAQTQAQIDAATASAQLQEALKRESDARAAIAKNAVDIANAEASGRAALTKAQADAEQARSSYYQSLVPDPSKYKVAEPHAPKLNASAAIRAFNETSDAAAAIGAEVHRVGRASDAAPCTREVWLLPGASMAATRSLIAASVSTEKSLEQMHFQIDSSRTDLAQAVHAAASAPAGPAIKSLGVTVAAAAAVVQGVLSIAAIAKPQFAFDSISQTSTSGSVLEAKVFGTMAATPCYRVLDTNALMLLLPLSQPPGPGGPMPAELSWVHAVRQQLAAARNEVRAALGDAQRLSAVAAAIRNRKGAQSAASAAEGAAERIVAAAKVVTDLANEAEKSLAALYAVDAQGNSLIDAAVRGGRLRTLLATHADATYFLTVKTVTSDVDLASKDGLFTKAATSLASNTVVSWQMTGVSGRVVSAGALGRATATEIRDVWP
jgi:hypothetical protein